MTYKEFLEKHERCNFQQSPEWAKVKGNWINEIVLAEDESGKIIGDVDFEKVSSKAIFFSPYPAQQKHPAFHSRRAKWNAGCFALCYLLKFFISGCRLLHRSGRSYR